MYTLKEFSIGFPSPLFSPVNCVVGDGELIHLEGPGGAGKTSFLQALSGILLQAPVYYGILSFKDKHPASFKNPGHFLYVSGIPGAGLLNATVQEELERGCNTIALPAEETAHRIKAVSEALEIAHLLTRNPSELSGGEQKLVELAAAFCMNPGVLLLDEPFANLSPKASMLLSHVIQAYHKNGSTIIIADHYLPAEMKQLSRSIKLNNAATSHACRRRESKTIRIPASQHVHTPFITADKIRHPFISNGQLPISFEIGKNKILHITGPNGSGKTTLLRILAGLREHDGRLHISGRPMNSSNKLIDWKVQAEYIGTALQNPESQFFMPTVEEELYAAHKKTAYTESFVHQLGLEHLLSNSPFTLSLGEQKRLQLASALIRSPGILLLDEIDAGLDELYLNKIASLLRGMQDIIIVYTTHNKEFADRLGGDVLHLSTNAAASKMIVTARKEMVLV